MIFSKYRMFGVFVTVYFLLASFKPWLDIYLGIPHFLVTGFQISLCFIVILLFIHKELSLKVPLFIFMIYVLARLAAELAHVYYEGRPYEEMVGAIYSAVRFIMFGGLVLLVGQYNNVKSARYLKYSLLAYFLLTCFYSILQHPMLGNSLLLQTAGGNVVSSNSLGFFRANGGVGGTVIAYANFLLAISWVIFYSEFANKKFHLFLKLCLLLSLYLCFSRSVFTGLLAMYLISIVYDKNLKAAFIMAIITLGIFYYQQTEVILNNYSMMVSYSDANRTEAWVNMFEGVNMLDLLMGSQVGQNTGLFLGDLEKNYSGDSFLLGTLNDFGLIGVILFVFVFTKFVFSFVGLKKSTKFGIFVSFILVLFINSGFEKLLVMLSYFLAIIIINSAPQVGHSARLEKIVSR